MLQPEHYTILKNGSKAEPDKQFGAEGNRLFSTSMAPNDFILFVMNLKESRGSFR